MLCADKLHPVQGRPCSARRQARQHCCRARRYPGLLMKAIFVEDTVASAAHPPLHGVAVEWRTLADAGHVLMSMGYWSDASQQGPSTQQETLGNLLYRLSQVADMLVAQQLEHVTPVSLGVVLAAGLATSLSPCTLSVLPLTIGYIGGYSSRRRPLIAGGEEGTAANGPTLAEAYEVDTKATAKATEPGGGSSATPATGSRATGRDFSSNVTAQAVCFAAGLATMLAALGVSSALFGRTFGQFGAAPIAVALVAIVMGLNLLEVVPLALPSLDVDTRHIRNIPAPAKAFLAGMAFSVAASPCSTPVLATLLAWVSTSHEPLTGGVLLLAYTAGYVAPLLFAASATGALKNLLELRQYSAWITPASGVLLVAGGTYALLVRLAPA